MLEPVFSLGTVLTGQGTLTVGTALGIVTATGKLKLLNSANTDGSQTLAAILNSTVNTASGDATNTPIVIGNALLPKANVILGGSDTTSTHWNAMGQAKSGVSIYVF
jgi:Bacteriophage lambda head decoration protein D